MTTDTEIHDLKQRVVDAEAKAAAVQLVQEISAGVAHNFNNILQIIMASASMIEMTDDMDKINKYASSIVDASRRGNAIAIRLSKFAHTMSYKGDPQPLDLTELMHNSIDHARIFWQSKPAKRGVSIHLKQDVTQGLTIVGLENELSEVFINLIKNSCEAMPDGGVLYISAKPGMGSIIINFTDTGTGIPKHIVHKVFSPFFTTKGDEGTGMGLATCRQIIEKHDGSISVSSSPGQTTFIIALPDYAPYISEQP